MGRDVKSPGDKRPVFSRVPAAPQTSSERRSGPADVCDVEPTSGKTAPTSVVCIISDTPTSSTETDSVQCSRQ
ncbi:hypothetical protein PF005_g31296 [Phytophthora fragariae]|uniref:Uncharacterized protein n=1 Tax=Phytophthora fragariae TaxID=53985 RepID=A0A6A3V755_9STRA|nr:hypothetical protein PF005_g31296 [Phytophthora fragariae]KAE9267009.1 hypothetical protein PF008_g31456 [Phytophthora fragariae]